jgi:predicted NAD/FAD-dependent oxidoreductase
MTAYLIVRAEVPEADRSAFDQWYETEHLQEAKAAFAAMSAARGWSDVVPGVHVALYAFPDLAMARAALQSDAIKTLIAAFDRVWQGRVSRSRDIIEVKQSL